MASSKEYLDFILEQLSELNDITHKAMMVNPRIRSYKLSDFTKEHEKKIIKAIYNVEVPALLWR